MAGAGETVETLDDIPHRIWKSLPRAIILRPSSVNQSRIGEMWVP